MFVPGHIVKKFISKKGKEMIIRYPKWEDLDEFTRYINKLSCEDTFVTFSGEEIKKEYEARALSEWFYQLEMGDKVVLGCFYKEKLLGLANIDRVNQREKEVFMWEFWVFRLKKSFGVREWGISYEK